MIYSKNRMHALLTSIKIFRKKLTRSDWFYLLILVGFFLITRLINLNQLPIFVDEGGYIFWAKQAFTKGDFYQSVYDGKPPLNVWGIALLINFFPNDPLSAARIFSVSTGLIAVLGFFILNNTLFGKRAAFISTSMYILMPFILFYDRLAIVDSMVNAVFIWMFIFAIFMARKTNFINSILFGTVAGIGLLTKGNVWIFIYVLAFTPLLIYKNGKLKKNTRLTLNFAFFYVVSILVALTLYSLALSPLPQAKELIDQKSQNFLYSVNELINNPFDLIIRNVVPRTLALLHMTGWISLAVSLLALVLLLQKNRYKATYFFVWLVGTLFVITFSTKHFFPRYLIFQASLIVLLAGYFISVSKNRKQAAALLITLLGIYAYLDYPILFDYQKLNFPKIERRQYIEDISAGYGIKEIIGFAKTKSKDKSVILLSEGIFGIGSNMIDAVIGVNEKNIQSIGSWPLTKEVLLSYQQLIPQKNIYVILNYRDESRVPKDWPIKFIKSYKKPYNYPYFSLYRLTK